jgi:hypothetical protein
MEQQGSPQDVQIAEYEACLSIHQHLDNMNSNVAAIFLGGSLAALGFILQRSDFPKLLPIVSLLSTVVVVGWGVVVYRADGLANVCFVRMEEIENRLDMHIQRYFNLYHHKQAPTYMFIWRRATIGGRQVKLFRLKTLHIFGIILLTYLGFLWAYTLHLF